ncbi:MAG: serine hydrolase [Firmicutes bacterium HGW-Firmicutes-20]|jgi:CubicO group peptidase (beta-lactamase class C family)|nr:MAG: serine hydrolase [Firmicutes bacterium HGW-Firmicutes-20]PKM86926.1 MAG: serine hydrolase [Firmicutes bacterium HGW-Firmicutes-10]
MNNIYLSEDFRGSLIIIQNGKIIADCQQGYADLPNKRPNNKDTRFASASAGKVFVAVGILMLVEKGLLRLNDTLGQLLPIDLHQIDPQVTIEQLLTHTSGVPDYFDEQVMDDYEELWKSFPNYNIRKNADVLQLFIDKPMQYQRGAKFSYNNSGFVLLALVIEQLTQKPFDVYLEEVIFKPCRMNSTGYYELDRLPSRCAINYIYCESTMSYRTNIFSVDAKGTGAGGAYITTRDISKFWDALINHRLLSEKMNEQMLQIHSQDQDGSCYGYGIWIRKGNENSSNIYYFQGFDPGVSFISEFDPNNKLQITLVSNFGDNVWHEIKKVREKF